MCRDLGMFLQLNRQSNVHHCSCQWERLVQLPMDGSVNGLTRLFKQSLLHLSLLRQKLFHLFLRNCLSSFKLNFNLHQFAQNMKYNYIGEWKETVLWNYKLSPPKCAITPRRFSSLNNFRRFKFSALSYGRNLITLIECTLF